MKIRSAFCSDCRNLSKILNVFSFDFWGFNIGFKPGIGKQQTTFHIALGPGFEPLASEGTGDCDTHHTSKPSLNMF